MGNRSETSPATAALTLRNVTKRFDGASGRVTALEDITLDVREGEFLAIVGPSGCGKSTLLSLLAGLEHTNEGTINLGDQPVEAPGRDRLVMFQQDALFPWLNVLENVLFGLRLKPDLTEAERLESARYYLNLVGLGNKEKARPHELSGGMRQRVALARSLAPNPRVLLMDEPFSALDALTREQLYGDLQEIFTKRKKTIVLVTHNIREAVCLGDRVVLLSPNPGRVRQVFNITKVGKVAGCQVTEGTVQRGAKVRLIRDNVVIHEGTLSTLKRFKDEVKEVQSGQECGMAFENYQDMREGDIIECYRVEEIRRSL